MKQGTKLSTCRVGHKEYLRVSDDSAIYLEDDGTCIVFDNEEEEARLFDYSGVYCLDFGTHDRSFDTLA